MKKISKNKKKFLILSTCIIFLITPKVKANNNVKVSYNDEYQIDSIIPYASYRNTNIFISREGIINKIRNDNSNDIYIIDKRFLKNSNMSISNSYEIRNIDEMSIIIDIILEYERQYPSNWNRSKESMLNEWVIHNISYYLNIQRHRSKEVDLDNNDEKKYILNLIK